MIFFSLHFGDLGIEMRDTKLSVNQMMIHMLKSDN